MMHAASQATGAVHTYPAQACPKPSPDNDDGALQLWRLKLALGHIESHLTSQSTLGALSDFVGLSPMHFAGCFRVATGMRPHEYVLRRKIEEAQIVLLTSQRPVVEVALHFGFLSQSHFTAVFRRYVGSTPVRWRQARLRQIDSAMGLLGGREAAAAALPGHAHAPSRTPPARQSDRP